jgi:putative flippase GtrA
MLKKILHKISLLKSINARTQRQLILFLFVGAINTAFSYACYALFIYLGLHYAVAAWFATCMGVVFNFNTTGRIVFNNSRAILIFKFIGVYMFLYCLNVAILKALQSISTNYYLNGFLAIFPVAAVAFVLNKFVVFREKYEVN